ncbi:MAG: glycosyltransferase [Holophagales bacterium]|nr:MAG: glycosyltransferase [Holophagales bacterium]
MLSVIMPTRNERENVELLIYTLLAILEPPTGGEFELLVVDDSVDGSDTYLAERLKPYRHVRFHHRAKGTGLGTAIGDGVEMARRKFVLAMDTDFNHNPLELPRLLAGMGKADLVGGSRFLSGGDMPGHRFRYHCSRTFNLFVRRTLGISTTDNLAGFWVAERERILALKRQWDFFYGYGDYYIRLLLAGHLLGWRVEELPVRYLQRLTGESKTSFVKELRRYTGTVLALKREIPALRSRLDGARSS